jgi:predicted GIY-YIG superfamily endonuclease
MMLKKFKMVNGPHYCYIIYNSHDMTYVGYTNCPEKRIRQHNGELQGGAKSTYNKGKWEYLAIIECLNSTYNVGLSCEWHLKHPTNKRLRPKQYNKKSGRINSIPLVLANPKFENLFIQINVISEYYDILLNLCKEYQNVKIYKFPNI